MVLTANKPTTSGTTRSASTASSTSSASSGCTSTVQRTRNIPIRIEPSKRALASPSVQRPQSTVRVQMNEFSVDFGGEEGEKKLKSDEVDAKPPADQPKSSSADRKTPPKADGTATSARRPSATSATSRTSLKSNGSGGSAGVRGSPSATASTTNRQPSTASNGSAERRSLHERRPSPSGSTGSTGSGRNGGVTSGILRSNATAERRTTTTRKSASPATSGGAAIVRKSASPSTPKSSTPASDSVGARRPSTASVGSSKSNGSAEPAVSNVKRASLGSIGRTASISENPAVEKIEEVPTPAETPEEPPANEQKTAEDNEKEVELTENARLSADDLPLPFSSLEVPPEADAVSTTATTGGGIPDTTVEELKPELAAVAQAEEKREGTPVVIEEPTVGSKEEEDEEDIDGDANVAATFFLPKTSQSTIRSESAEEAAGASSSPPSVHVVPVEVHRRAESDDAVLEASATDDDMLSPSATTDDERQTASPAASAPLHSTERSLNLPSTANADTLSTTATTGGFTPDDEAEKLEIERKEDEPDAEQPQEDEEKPPILTKIAYQSPTAELHVPADEACHEVSIEVNEKRSEDGQLSTRIVLDSQSNAIAARDVSVEIRRRVRTEFSPPTCTTAGGEPKEEPKTAASKSQPPLQVGRAVAASFDEPRAAKAASAPTDVKQEGEKPPTEDEKKPEVRDEGSPADAKKEVERWTPIREVTPPIVPFVFKEGRAASAGQFRDVAIRVEPTPPPAASSEPPAVRVATPEIVVEFVEKEDEQPPVVEETKRKEEPPVQQPQTTAEEKKAAEQPKAPIAEDEVEDTRITITSEDAKEEPEPVEREAEQPTEKPVEQPKEVASNEKTPEEKTTVNERKITPVLIGTPASEESTTSKGATPFEEIAVEVVERRPSTKDLAEVRVYRERYSEAPVLPYPGTSPAAPKNEEKPTDSPALPRAVRIQNARDELADQPPLDRKATSQQEARLDLSGLKKKPTDETEQKAATSPKVARRPLISPVSPTEKQKVLEITQQTTRIEEKPAVVSTQRPRILDNGQRELNDVDETIERLKKEPIRLNIARSLPQHSPNGAQSPPQLSTYEGVDQKTLEERKREPLNGYPSPVELNGLYRPHPLEARQAKEATPPFQSIAAPGQQQQQVTTTITTQTNLTTNVVQEGTPSPTAQNLRPSSRLSQGTGVRSDNDFTPRTLSRINHLNVIMERNGEKDVGEVIHHHPVFMRDTSKYWYKPTISREEAIAMLKDKEPGTFVVRDSNSFPGAFGLALKVAQPPAGVPTTDGTELVRHFLIEPSPKGVKLKGCSNEPVFGTLAALIYQHSITPMALPAKLILPDFDPAETPEHLNANQALLERGAACNVTYICSLDTESLTGPEAVRRAVSTGLAQLTQRSLRAIPVHFKVSSQGITLTDNTRSLFFRRHYPVTTVTFAGIDPESRLFDNNNASQLPSTYIRQAPMFGFVARKSASSLENACHVFAELDPEQPASAVVRFITNVMMTLGRQQQQQIHRATAGV